ncbi:GAF domain-like protein [Neoconidiobolus thromboides FSU 785]|nr:GAF domain-like protein [Neoconidiobolus thromboides FSU 785]
MTFTTSEIKKQFWKDINLQLDSLMESETNWVTNLANTSALLWQELREPSLHELPSRAINWAGFYLIDKKNTKDLILGPFQGKIACVRIPIGKGVCGVGASSKLTQLVYDVHEFPGHIACDSASNSEIVVPLIVNDKVIGVIDIDCETVGGFDKEDQVGLEELAKIIIKSCDFEDLLSALE